MPENVKVGKGITFPARVIKHDTKSTTKDGVDVLKVTLQAACVVGGEAVRTPVTIAFRYAQEEVDQYALNDDFEITISRAKKPA